MRLGGLRTKTRRKPFCSLWHGVFILYQPVRTVTHAPSFERQRLLWSPCDADGDFFGLGAVLVPFLFYGFFLSTLTHGLLGEFKKYTKHIEAAAALFLAAVGIALLGGQIHL